jgi:serpin B
VKELAAAPPRRGDQARSVEGAPAPVELVVANRLFTQSGFALRPAFTATLREHFGAPLEELDFVRAVEPSRRRINAWAARETRDRIRDLIPPGALDADTRAVLANAIYLRAPWASPFEPGATRNEPFWVAGLTRVEVPTMIREGGCGYQKRDGFTALALPYAGGRLHFIVLLPDEREGLAALERRVTPTLLADCAKLPWRGVILRLPKFKVEPPVLPLGGLLRGLGMTTAFDQPRGTANFDRMAPRMPRDYLYISEVFHRTWLALDESGTEAAAATAVVMARAAAAVGKRPEPLDVRVDRPFLFALRDVPTGAILFLGQVADPSASE